MAYSISLKWNKEDNTTHIELQNAIVNKAIHILNVEKHVKCYKENLIGVKMEIQYTSSTVYKVTFEREEKLISTTVLITY